MSDITHELQKFIVTEITSRPGIDSIGRDHDLIREGIVDSLGVQELVEFIESRYAISVEADDVVPENFQTLAQLAAFVDRRRSES
jgi:acyl carrier protein